MSCSKRQSHDIFIASRNDISWRPVRSGNSYRLTTFSVRPSVEAFEKVPVFYTGLKTSIRTVHEFLKFRRERHENYGFLREDGLSRHDTQYSTGLNGP